MIIILGSMVLNWVSNPVFLALQSEGLLSGLCGIVELFFSLLKQLKTMVIHTL